MQIKSANLIYGCSIFAVFLFIFIFFSAVHPLVPFDGDDWVNLSLSRSAIPRVGGFNPIKILPETLFPLVGLIAAYVVFPITEQYLQSITLVSAFTVAIFTSLLFWTGTKAFSSLFHIGKIPAIFLSILFITAHFILFRKNSADNYYLLWAPNLTCYMHYVIPNLVNSSLVLWLISHPRIQQEYRAWPPLKKGCFYIAVYFAIFSNLFNNAILAAYCGAVLLLAFIKKDGNPVHRIRSLWSSHKLFAIITILWFLSALIEATGGRARSVGNHGFQIIESLKASGVLLHSLDKNMIIIFAVFLLLTLYLYWKCRNRSSESSFDSPIFPLLGLSFVLMTLYLILLGAKSAPGYLTRPDAVYGFYFYLLLLMTAMIACCIHKAPGIQSVLPLLTVILILSNVGGSKPLRESNFPNIAPSSAYSVSQYLIDQLQTADRAGLSSITLYVPKGDNNDNWPHPDYMGDNIMRTLYLHGLVSTVHIHAVIVPDPALNEKFYKHSNDNQ